MKTLEFIYISHLKKNKQKNLAYALGVAKAFSGSLSLLPACQLQDHARKKIPIWKPQRQKEAAFQMYSISNGSRNRAWQQRQPVFLLGKPHRACALETMVPVLAKQILDAGYPLFLLPFDHTFEGIKNVLFTGNTQGLTDHFLQHQIAARFLPKAYKLENATLEQIHWNNIWKIAGHYNLDGLASYNEHLQHHNIDLIVLPATHSLPAVLANPVEDIRRLMPLAVPTLLIPTVRTSNSKEVILSSSVSPAVPLYSSQRAV
jgi:hypothetical protein